MIDQGLCEGHRIDEEARDDEKAWDEQGLAEKC